MVQTVLMCSGISANVVAQIKCIKSTMLMTDFKNSNITATIVVQQMMLKSKASAIKNSCYKKCSTQLVYNLCINEFTFLKY